MRIDKAWLNLTSSCNNKCVWCYAKNQSKSRKDLDTLELNKILSALDKIGCKKINLVGGEPTLHPRIIDILSKCHSQFFKVCIISNGRNFSNINFTRTVAQYKESTYVAFSVEGPRSIHNKITMTDSYNESINGIRNCITEGIKVAVNTTLCHKNADSMSFLYKELISMGVDNFAMNFAIPPLNSSFNSADYLKISSINNTLKEILTFIEQYKINFIFTTPLPFCAFDSNILSSIKSGVISINQMCHIFNGAGITFDTSGNIVLCTHLSDIILRKSNKTLNIDNFDRFWDIELEKEVRKNIRRYPSVTCSSCEHKQNCTGGCPVLWQFDFFYSELFNNYEN